MKVIRIRASSFGELLDCAHRWEAKHILGMRLPSSGPARLGTAIHAGTAAFDKARLSGSPITAIDAVDVTMDTLRSNDEEVAWGDMRPRDAEQVGAVLTTRYCTEVAPTRTYAAVELELKPLVINVGDGIGIELTGTMDRARIETVGNEIGIDDVKTGARAVTTDGRAETKGHAPQLGVYELLVENTLKQRVTLPARIIGMRTNKSNPAIALGEVRGARENLVGTEDDPGMIDFAADMLKAGRFPPNPRSQLCSAKFCPRWATCKFHD